MKSQHRFHLTQKGWTERELQHAESVLDRTARHDVHFSKIVFWSAILVIVFANIIVSIALVMFLIVLENWVLYSLIIIMALLVGILYNFLITNIGHLEQKHHILASILIPSLSLLNIIGMVILANKFITSLKIEKAHDPLFIGFLFAAAFIVPYLISRITEQQYLKKAVPLQ